MHWQRRNTSSSNISGYIGEAILVLDYEGSAVYQGVGWAKDWMDAVYNMTGVKPLNLHVE